MKGDRIQATVLSIQEIPNADPFLLKALKVPEGYRSLGLMTSDIDDISYAAIDEATKKAEVIVTYAHSMYAGSGNASTELAGEFIGILAGPDPAEVKAGIVAFSEYVQNDAFFYSANDSGSIPYFRIARWAMRIDGPSRPIWHTSRHLPQSRHLSEISSMRFSLPRRILRLR